MMLCYVAVIMCVWGIAACEIYDDISHHTDTHPPPPPTPHLLNHDSDTQAQGGILVSSSQ